MGRDKSIDCCVIHAAAEYIAACEASKEGRGIANMIFDYIQCFDRQTELSMDAKKSAVSNQSPVPVHLLGSSQQFLMASCAGPKLRST